MQMNSAAREHSERTVSWASEHAVTRLKPHWTKICGLMQLWATLPSKTAPESYHHLTKEPNHQLIDRAKITIPTILPALTPPQRGPDFIWKHYLCKIIAPGIKAPAHQGDHQHPNLAKVRHGRGAILWTLTISHNSAHGRTPIHKFSTSHHSALSTTPRSRIDFQFSSMMLSVLIMSEAAPILCSLSPFSLHD
jgi:hypothetical protein